MEPASSLRAQRSNPGERRASHVLWIASSHVPRNDGSGSRGALHSDGPGLAPSRQRSGRFGFSWALVVSPRNPHLRPLDFLGFPWILSSESRLINGLPGINRAKVFLGASPRRAAPERDAVVEAMRKRRIGHRASLAYFLVFGNRAPHKFCTMLWPSSTVGSCLS
jgi:hypothetical protein